MLTYDTMPVRELARAKVNLCLKVRGRRADGYHELESLVTFAGVHDVVTLDPTGASRVVVTGPFAQYISGENLLIRALALLRDADKTLRLGSVRLEKNLPVAAGVGGGSADAAALLRAARSANAGRADDIPWLDIAGRLGADVPVCFLDRPALISGRGDRIAPLRRLPRISAVLVNPRLALPTARVFAALKTDAALAMQFAPSPPELPELESLIDYVRARGNDLEPAALSLLPEIGEVKSSLAAQRGCRLAAMSGSGPTCFGIFSDRGSARHAADMVAAEHSSWWVRSTTLAGAA